MGNYFTIAWRNLKQNASYTVINIGGLSLGIACALLIYTVVAHQLHVDDFHPHNDRIYRTVSVYSYDSKEYQPGVPQPLGKAFRNEFDFAEKAAMVNTYRDALIALPAHAGVKFEEPAGVAYAEPEFFDIFHFPLWKGDKATALTAPNSALITRSLAKKYFGTEDAIGQLIRYDNKTTFTITGILEEIPSYTDRRQQIYLSYSNMREKNAWLASDSSWTSVRSAMNFFVRLKPGVTGAQVEKAYPTLAKKYLPASDAAATTFLMQPLRDIHFNTNYDGYTNRKYLWTLSLIGILLVVTACVNFVNLATAQALKRAKEVGVRKVMGSTPLQLFIQFMAETALLCCFALLLAFGLAQLCLPLVNRLLNLHMALSVFQTPSLLLFMGLLLVTVIFLSGFYPAIVLTRFQPVEALKGKLSQKNIGGFSLRRVLVIAQFGISQMLIIGSLVIMSQMRYSGTANLGFHKTGIILTPLPAASKEKQHTLQQRLTQLNGVHNVSLCFQAPAAENNNYTTIRLASESRSRNWNLNMKESDQQYASLFGLHFVAGQNFHTNDTLTGFILNQTAVAKLGFASPQQAIGQMITVNGDAYTAPITGVVKDFNNQSFRSAVEPVCLMVNPRYYRNCAISLQMNNAHQTLAAIEKIWCETFPEQLYKHEFLDDRLARFYELDTIMLRLVQAFSLIAIFIGCLGLYGLVTFMAAQKNKEIGVRKVLGAHLADILWLFGRELALLLVIAFVFAVPVAWWVMNKYLQEFSYRIHIGPGIFITAILCSMVIAVFTAGYRSFKAALLSPLKSLRAE